MTQTTMLMFCSSGSSWRWFPSPSSGCNPSSAVHSGPASALSSSFPHHMLSPFLLRFKQHRRVSMYPHCQTSQEDDTTVEEGLRRRVKDTIFKVIPSASSFDTAWVAMVPSPTSHLMPCFPECLEWILKNQNMDGSWTNNGNCMYLVKDCLSSTLACIIALKRWNIGAKHIKRGIEFIERNSSFLIDNGQHSPIGFNTIFVGMIRSSKLLGLDIPIMNDIMSAMYALRDIELKSEATTSQWKAYLGYVDEGADPIQYYEKVVKGYQKRNGSLFNSPSATAAMLIHIHDVNAMKYLRDAILVIGNAVTAVHPSNLCARLAMVDTLEKLGISHYFSDEIERIMDETYRAWLLNEEEIRTEIFTCALAFRLMRIHGYDISSDVFARVDVDELLSYKWNSYPQVTAAMELYRASRLQLGENEIQLKKLKRWSTHFMKQSLSMFTADNAFEKQIIDETTSAVVTKKHFLVTNQIHSVLDAVLVLSEISIFSAAEVYTKICHNNEFVRYCLKNSIFENFDFLKIKRSIETYNDNSVQCLKASFMLHKTDGVDMLKLAIHDFNTRRATYIKEFCLIERWYHEKHLHQLAKGKLKGLLYTYFTAAFSIHSPKLYEARMAWAKGLILVCLIDEFFDDFGSTEEQDNFVDLCQRWSSEFKIHCCSENVYILFDALYTTVEELGTKADSTHGHAITKYIIELWVELVNAMKKESEWKKNGIVPTMDEYMENGYITIGFRSVVLPAALFMSNNLSWDIIRSNEYHQLQKLVSIFARLMNDMQSNEREATENKLTTISLKMLHGDGMISKEDAKKDVWNMIEATRNKLSRMILKNKGSVVPRACKDLFWNTSKVLYAFYKSDDGLRDSEFMAVVKLTMEEPIISSFSNQYK